MDTAIQRKNMVESQVRPSDITDRRIVRAMLEIEREKFLPESVRALAYMDGPVTLTKGPGGRRSLLAARIFAKMVQAAAIEPTAAVLDVGAASGYSSAVLARLAGSVVALECDGALAKLAQDTLPAVGAGAVTVITGDLAEGWAPEGPYDAILIEGTVDAVPRALLDQLKDGGRLVAIVGNGRSGRATVWRRDGATFGAVDAFDANADVLPGFEKAPDFAF